MKNTWFNYLPFDGPVPGPFHPPDTCRLLSGHLPVSFRHPRQLHVDSSASPLCRNRGTPHTVGICRLKMLTLLHTRPTTWPNRSQDASTVIGIGHRMSSCACTRGRVSRGPRLKYGCMQGGAQCSRRDPEVEPCASISPEQFTRGNGDAHNQSDSSIASLTRNMRPCGATTVTHAGTSFVTELPEAAAQITPQYSQTANPTRKPLLSMRPTPSYIKVMVAGGRDHVRKVPYYRMAGTDGAIPEDTHGNLQTPVETTPRCFIEEFKVATTSFVQPSAWASDLKTMLVPEASCELLYIFENTPGQCSALDSFMHLECLLTFVLKKQAMDYEMLGGCRGLIESLACKCLEHSPTVCIYTLPPEGPSRADLMIMSVLSQWVALLPVICGTMSTKDADKEACQQLVSDMLRCPALYVPGLPPMHLVNLTQGDGSTLQLPILLVNTSAGDVSDFLLKFICMEKVYDLLDLAWDRYTFFCGRYEAAGKNVSVLSAEVNQQLAGCITQGGDYYHI